MKSPEHQRELDRATSLEEPRPHKRVGKKPFVLKITIDYGKMRIWGARSRSYTLRYGTQVARDHALKHFNRKTWLGWTYSAEIVE